MPGYTISPDGKSITCHNCGKTSSHPKDVSQHYCGNCHAYHGDGDGSESDPVAVAALVARMMVILAGHPPAIQGGAIADVLSMFITGHHPILREEVLRETVDCARKLIPVNEKIMFPDGHPFK